jgi:hypothetical protein
MRWRLGMAAGAIALAVGGCGGCRPSTDVCSNADGALDTAAFVFVTTPRSGERVRSGFTVRGCSRTFESNVPWRLVDATGAQIASGATNGGGVDGPGPFETTVAFTVPQRQIGHLEIGDEDVSDGESPLKPVRNVIPLVLQP